MSSDMKRLPMWKSDMFFKLADMNFLLWVQ